MNEPQHIDDAIAEASLIMEQQAASNNPNGSIMTAALYTGQTIALKRVKSGEIVTYEMKALAKLHEWCEEMGVYENLLDEIVTNELCDSDGLRAVKEAGVRARLIVEGEVSP
ncbi:MAG: hypothetical protein HKN37_16410 [Rhodothermales bacterium]|nr:hypothetical protein [Rhodothermales bacterium]